MVVVVTGASGHIGANLVRALLERGDAVRAVVHRDSLSLQGLNVELVGGDVCDPVSLRRCFDGADTVYHLAGHITITREGNSRAEEVNCAGTRNVVRACVDRRVRRLVHFSSIHAVADPGSEVVDEAAPLLDAPRYPAYNRTKAVAERLVLNAVSEGLNAVVLAPTGVVGPYDLRPSHFGRVLLLMAQGRLPVIMTGGFNWVDVRDVVLGAMVAADRAAPGSKYLLSGHWCSLQEIAGLVADICGARRPRFVVPRVLAQAFSPAAETACALLNMDPLFTSYSMRAVCGHRYVSHARASTELGYAPRPLLETLVDTCRWFSESGRLAAECLREPSHQ